MLDLDIRNRLATVQPSLVSAGIAHLAVFGSRARGSAKPESDLDVLIELLPERKFSLFDLVGVEQTLSEATGLRANAIMRRSLDAKFRERIEPEIVEIF
jgi:predicted nucleotidyltransferase